MRFTIITVSFNSESSITESMLSVAQQTYPDVEHIVIDGGSTDRTVAIIEKYLRQGGGYISEPDTGLYDAMNKGIAMASGDVIGLLNSDDVYADCDVLRHVGERFAEEKTDAVISDVGFFRASEPGKLIRRYDSSYFTPAKLGWGWMPAHPGMFLTKAAYDEIGQYRTDYTIAADFEFIARAFGVKKISFSYLPLVAVMMRTGGISTSGLRSQITINSEVLRACRENGINSNMAMLMSKYPRKMMEKWI